MEKLRFSELEFEANIRTVKDADEIVKILQKSNIFKVGIVDKLSNRFNLELAYPLLDQEGITIMPHYSLSVHYGGSAQVAQSNLEKFLHHCRQSRIPKILLVSGPKRRKFDTLSALDCISRNNQADAMQISVAYNPFLPSTALAEENNRLKQKLKYPFVTHVYFQIGFNAEKMQQAANKINSLRPDINISAALLIPTKAIQSSLSYRLWKGVTLPAQFFAPPEQSMELVSTYLTALQSSAVNPYIEAFPLKEGIALLDLGNIQFAKNLSVM